jgi:NAD(P)-dependent dehydrogenase (short-subunit alcohol dehydrogenase family)
MNIIESNFRGGVAVITGAGSGIGEGLARLAAQAGMRVVLADISVTDMERVVGDIRAAGGEAMAVYTDVSRPEALDLLARRTHEAFGDVRLLINNAGIETVGYTWDLSVAQWERTLDVNLHGVIHAVRAFAPRMIAAGKPSWIANTSSTGGLNMLPLQTPYVLCKHAILSFSECLYLEMQEKKAPVQVSVVIPGPVNSRIFANPESAGAGVDPAVAEHVQLMRDYLARFGIAPIEAARRILEGIAAGEFWVSTHPEITAEVAARRALHLSTLARPAMPPMRAKKALEA